MHKIKRILRDTRGVWKTKWDASQVRIGTWFLQATIWIVVARSASYGLELILLANNPVSQVMAFAGVLGLPVWGWIILVSVLVVILGMILRNMLLVTIGILSCLAVWIAFSGVITVGWLVAGHGGRFAVNAMCTAGIWVSLFVVHLQSIKRNGVHK